VAGSLEKKEVRRSMKKIITATVVGLVLLLAVGSSLAAAVLYRDAQARDALSAVVATAAATEAVKTEKKLSQHGPARKKLAGTAEKPKDTKVKTGAELGVLRMPHTDGPILIREGTNALGRETKLLNTGSAVRYVDSSKDFGHGVVAISGHRTTYGAPFRYLNLMEKGDVATVRTKTGTYHFSYVETRIVKPTDVWIIQPAKRVKELKGGGLVMSACHPLHSARQRIVVFWRFQSFTPN
jgi:sortase A